MSIPKLRNDWHKHLRRLAVGAVAVALSACADAPVSPAALSPDLATGGPALAKAPTVSVCHRTGSGSYRLLTINGNALPAHLGHGDLTPGAEVPDGTGATLDAECVPQVADVTGTYTLRTLGGETLPALGTGELVIAMTIVLDEGGSCSLGGTVRGAQEDPDGEIEDFVFGSCSYTLVGSELTLTLGFEDGEFSVTAELVGDEITLQIRIWDEAEGTEEEDAPFGDAVFVKV